MSQHHVQEPSRCQPAAPFIYNIIEYCWEEFIKYIEKKEKRKYIPFPGVCRLALSGSSSPRLVWARGEPAPHAEPQLAQPAAPGLAFPGACHPQAVRVTAEAGTGLRVIPNPNGRAQDPSWRSLLHFCAARCAFRGAGAELVAGVRPAREGVEGECAATVGVQE